MKNQHLKTNVLRIIFFPLFVSFLFLTGCLPEEEEDDAVALSVVATSPSNASTEVNVSINISITFSQAVAAGDVNAVNFRLVSSQGQEVNATYNAAGNTVIIDPTGDLLFNTTYEVSIVPGIESADGGMLEAPYRFSFRTQGQPDSTPPSIVSANNSGEIDLDQNLTVTFSEPLSSSTVNSTNFSLRTSTGSAVSASVTISDRTVTVNPTAKLRGGNTLYTLLVSGNVTDLGGNRLGSTEEVTYRTTNTEVRLVEMVGGTTDVAIGEALEFEFSAALDPSSIVAAEYRVGSIQGTVSVNGNILSFTPSQVIKEFGTDYTFTYPASLRDVDGNRPAASGRSISFVTEFLSENFWYGISNLSANNAGWMFFATDGEFRMNFTSSNFSDFCNTQFSFSRVETSVGVRYLISHQCADGRLLEGGGKNGLAYMAPRPGEGQWFTGQAWNFTFEQNSGGTDYYSMTNQFLQGQGYFLNGSDRGMWSTANTSDFDGYFWAFTRGPRR